MYFQDTYYEENPVTGWHGVSQYEYCPSIRTTIFKKLKVGVNTAIFNYSDNLNTFTGSIEPMALRNNRDLGMIIGVVGGFPSQTQTLSAAYRIIKPLEIFGEWSNISFQNSVPSGTLNAYGIRYFLTENFAFSINFINFSNQSYNTLGLGFYW